MIHDPNIDRASLNADQREILDYWSARCRGDRLPRRKDVDPLDFPHLLPFLMLVDVLRDPRDFRFRLVGTGFYNFSKAPLTKRLFSEVFKPTDKSVIWRDYMSVVQTTRPYYGEVPYVGPSSRAKHVYHLLLPLAENGVDVDMILNCAEFQLSDGDHQRLL